MPLCLKQLIGLTMYIALIIFWDMILPWGVHEVKTMKWTLLLVSADNLDLNFIGGYKALDTALRKCHTAQQLMLIRVWGNISLNVVLHTAVFLLQFTDATFVSRTIGAHKRYIEALAGPNRSHIATTYGVVPDSVLRIYCIGNICSLFEIKILYSPSQFYQTFMMLMSFMMFREGVLQYEVKLLLNYLIYEERLLSLVQTVSSTGIVWVWLQYGKGQAVTHIWLPSSVYAKQFTETVR